MRPSARPTLYRLLATSVSAVLLLLASLPLQQVGALPAPQDPATEAIITLEADGLAPFDATTFDLATNANAGTDGAGTNGVVRNFDSVTYNVEVTLNDADDTNLLATVTLNDKASWAALPTECRTVAAGFTITPDSSITDTTGDGLFDTLVCNLGDHNEGTKILFKPVAVATGNNTDLISASVMSSSDSNVNTTGLPGTQGDGPIETVITTGFGINLTKMPCGLPERNDIPNETNCATQNINTDKVDPASPELRFLPWHITLNYDSGSEFVADNGAGTQDFTITDTWIGTHSDDPTINSNNANGDFDDQVQLAGAYTGNPLDSCDFATPIPGATVTCTQAGPGQPVIIDLTGIPVNQSPMATVVLTMAFDHDIIFLPNGDGLESYNIDNTATLTGWGGAGAMVTSTTGTIDPGPESATEDYSIGSIPPGPWAAYKSFDSIGPFKTGTRAAAPGDIVETSLTIIDAISGDHLSGLCDTIDTSVFEFAGHLPIGQLDGIAHGNPTPYGANGGFRPVHEVANPVLIVATNAGAWTNSVALDALQHGVSVEFSDVDYATTGDDHWTATCEDDLTGDGVSDWVTDASTLPGGVPSVVRVRFIWDKVYSDIAGLLPGWTTSNVTFSFDLMIKPTAPVNTRLPNAAATMRTGPNSANWAGPERWLNTQDGAVWNVYGQVEDDPTAPLFSFNVVNADRVFVVPASMSITKQNNPIDQGPLSGGDTASFTIDPNVSGDGPAAQTMTFTDTLPARLTYVGDDCAAAYAAVGLTCTAVVAGQTITWTVTGYTIGDELPPFVLDTTVNAGTPANTYTNTVTIGSSYALLSDSSFCVDAVNASGASNTAACEAAFVKPHSDTASIQVLAQSGVEVIKADDVTIVEPRSAYDATLSYINLGGSPVGVGQLIDIVPYNGDGVLAPNYSPQRFNSENGSNANNATQTADPDGAVDFVAIAPSAAGETFEYSTDPHATIDHRPCHPDNWPAGDTEATNATISLVCERGLIDPATDVPTLGQAGTGATTWGPAPAVAADVTAIRASTPAFPGGQPQRDLLLEMNTGFAIEGDLFCNNFGANADIITLDIISNDVCAEVVAGSIGDYVWHDANSDGVQDASEDPIPGVDIKLLVEDPANPGSYIPFQIPDPNNPGQLIDYVATTDADGAYLFENLPSGNYRVMVDPTTLPLDAQQTFDDNGGLDNMSDVSLFGPNNPETPDSVYSDVDDNLDQDFGYVFPEVDLALTKATAATFVVPGQDVTYTITVHNQGDVDMADATVADYLPAGLSMSATDTNGWTTDGTTPTSGGEGGTVYAVVAGPIPAGGTATIDIVLTVAPGATAGDLVNTAEITGMTDTLGRDRTGDDIDSTADDTDGNDAGGAIGTDQDGHIDDDGLDTDGDGILDEDDSDPAAVTVWLPEAGIDIEKATNGVDSDEAPGELIPAGETLSWTYDVTNTGTTALANATVTDDQGVTVDCGDGTNTIALLLPGETITCTGTGTATAGPYTNNADVSGDPIVPDFATCGCDPADPATWPTDPDAFTPALGNDGQPMGPVVDEDPSNYTGQAPGAAIDIEKATNGVDSDEAPGETIAVGDPVMWTYDVTNIGTTALANATVTDSQGVAVDCGDGTNVIALLLPGEVVTCTGTGTAIEGPYSNDSDVTGDPVVPDFATCGCDPADPATWPTDPGAFTPALGDDGQPLAAVTDEDPSNYTGEAATLPFTSGIDLEKATNGVDSDEAPGESINVGDAVTWTYVVTNTGTAALTNVTVTDDQGVAVDCGDGTNVIALLLPGEMVTCTGTGTAVDGQYTNNATITGDPAVPDFATCGCDPDDPATWPTDPGAFGPATGTDGQTLGPVTDGDSSNYIGLPRTLAFTGSETRELLRLALASLLVGALALTAGRRTTRQSGVRV